MIRPSFFQKWIFVLPGFWILLIMIIPWPVHGNDSLGIIDPVQTTYETTSIQSMAVSRDAGKLICSMEKNGFSDLWLYSADPQKIVFPRQITDDPSVESSPAFSPDGRFIAYTGRSYDVKGDIYLLDIETPGSIPKRLTDRETRDAGACFDPSGKILYFHQILPGETLPRLVSLRLDESHPIRTMDTGTDGSDPDVSPDGRKICYTSYRSDPSGAIMTYDLQTGERRTITQGPALDSSPVWSADGKTIFFARIFIDTDQDGQVTYRDNAVLFKVNTDQPDPEPFPLSRFDKTARNPIAADGKLFFISPLNRNIDNCYFLPEQGMIPQQRDATMQTLYCSRLDDDIRFDPFVKILAWSKVTEFGKVREAGSAAYRIGRILEDHELLQASIWYYQSVSADFGHVEPAASLSSVAGIAADARLRLKKTAHADEKSHIIQSAVEELKSMSRKQNGISKARADIETARLLFQADSRADSLLASIRLLDTVIHSFPELDDENAEATALKAEIYKKLGRDQDAYALYTAIIRNYPDQTKWVTAAVRQALDHFLQSKEGSDLEEKIYFLRDLSEKNHKELPVLAAGALNRAADLYVADDQWAQAKEYYRLVLDRYPLLPFPAAASRLALAEILYREERFREALELYEAQINQKTGIPATGKEHIVALARRGYIRKSIASGEYLFRIGEVPSAMSRFRELIDFQYGIVEAHRGYIKCAAALDKVDDLLNRYRSRNMEQPEDAVSLYGTALLLTYQNTKPSLLEAKTLLEKTIQLNGQVEYFHQTLGYVSEVLETVYGEKGHLEAALESYKKAYFLNDDQQDPDNRSHLALNIGNIHYNLGQFHQALKYYTVRMEAGTPFDNPDTEIGFYQRLGTAAFQSEDNRKTISAFQNAIRLVRQTMDPYSSVRMLEKIHRFVMDEIIMPAAGQDELQQEAEAMSALQANIYGNLTKISENLLPPPSDEWIHFQDQMTDLLGRQEKILPELLSLVEKNKQTGLKRTEAEQKLEWLVLNAKKNLQHPSRMVTMEAEMRDRLGLAFQENRQYMDAVDQFEKAFSLNQKLGIFRNLAVNRRSVAYNLYMQATLVHGNEKMQILQKAMKHFEDAETLLDQYGVASRKQGKDKEGLMDLSLSVALDKKGTTQAAHGFSLIQEKRLISAFLTRINMELGNMIPAEEQIIKQLAEYPPDRIIDDQDLYGVSLLYHRAGLLSAARKKYKEAFSYFEQSARLSHRYGNPVSTCINVMNMAHVLSGISGIDDDRRLSKFLKLQKQTGELLRSSGMYNPVFSAGYYNTIGQHMLILQNQTDQTDQPEQSPAEISVSVNRFLMIRNAISFLDQGIRLLKGDNRPGTREKNALLASLHLNKAIAASLAGEEGHSGRHFQTALTIAEQSLLPDLEWRALVGLGRHEEALSAISRVTIMRAGCRPSEITGSFHPPVLDLIRSGEHEDAFHLIEKISELERFNRLAFLYRNALEKDKKLIRNAYPVIERIKTLRSSIEKAKLEEQGYLKKRISDETEILAQRLGKDYEKLPDEIRWIEDKTLRENCIVLLGIAAEAEDTADAFVRETEPEQMTVLKDRYRHLIGQYHDQRIQLAEKRPEGVSSDPVTFLGPEPVDAMDIMESLPDGRMLVRLFKAGPDVYSFIITNDGIEMNRFPSIAASVENLPESDTIAIAYEYPLEVPGQRTRSLSGTHFYRSFVNRKPFKNTIVSIPEPLADQEGYQIFQIGKTSNEKQDEQSIPLSGMNTLFLTGKVSVSTTIPTRSGEGPDLFLSFENQDGNPDPLEPLLIPARNLSLAVLAESSPDDVYLIGNLFSLRHCPSVLFHPTMDETSIHELFDKYRTNTIQDAIQGLTEKPSASPDPEMILLGYPGMSSAETDIFLQETFVQIVKNGKTAFDEGRNGEAFSHFRNALEISEQYEKFQSLTPRLLEYCRETAYRENDLDRAALFAGKLVKRMEETSPDSEKHAEALLRSGLIEAGREKFSKAISLLDESVAMLENLELDEQQVLALSELGYLLENATEYDRALTVFRSAAEISDNIGQETLLADQHMNTGRIYDLRLSRYVSAIQYYQKALLIYQDRNDLPKTAQVMLDIGRCYRLLGNFPLADESFRNALAMMENNHEMKQLAAKILIEQANNAWFQASYQKAFSLQRRAYEISVISDLPLVQVICLNTSGLIWWTLGNHQKALYELEKALEMANRIPNRKDEVASTLNNIGLVLRETGRYQEAMETFDRALAIDEKLQSRWAIAYDLRNKALALFQMGKAKDAIPLFEKSAEQSNEIGNQINEAKALLGLADALRSENRFNEARESYKRSLTLASGMNIPETRWRAMYGMARLDLPADPVSAEKQLRDAIDVIETMRADIRIEQLKESFSDNKFMVYETLVRLLADNGKTEESFEIAERSRARSFIDLLGNRQLDLNHEKDQVLYDKQKMIRIKMDETKILMAQSAEDQERKVYQKTLAELEHEYRNVMLDIQSGNPQLASMISVTPLRAEDIPEQMDPGTALLSYYILDDEIFCWVIQKGITQTHGQPVMTLFRSGIGKTELGENILEYRRAIQNLEPYETLSKSLYSLLLEQPLSSLGGIRNLGIIPHGPLHYLSFATLFNGKNFLVDEHALFYLPSASVWKYTKEMRKPQKNTNVLAIGNPDLGDPVLDLPFAEHEVGTIPWNFPDITVLTKGKASEEWVSKNIGRFGIIHLASHGEFDPINPLFSAIKLSGSYAFDGNLETAEIFGLRINADMVVLSACQSGLGKVTGGDDVIGLNRAFFYAGTHTVISSLWRVSDVSTALLIKTFYRRYTAHNKSDSLKYAMLHVKNRYPHPGYWGAFTLVGDYQ
ncbi:MAG: CHAT domain-containing protein [Desulfobacteraceae bacterium]|nr:MAG: CHAT domain-containing protein [Desulfobacteraceae bacterium]